MMRIRRATAEDCPAMLELIKELALFEKAPDEVSVDPKHFEESGFGEKPVWWGFVVEDVEGGLERFSEVEENSTSSTSLNLSKPHSTSLNVSQPLPPLSPLPPPSPLIAFALYYIRYSTWKGQVMYLEDILVTEEMRGKGVGTMLMNRVIEEAKEKGFKRISWQVLDWNEPAIEFYKKYGASFDGEWVNVNLDL
jgi:GNAT superfamily N-acetyltransferase